jgi:small subunit ribosomal protein S10
MSLHNIKVKFKAFHNGVLDKVVSNVVNRIVEFGGTVCGPIPMPKRIERFTVNRSPHVDRKSMDQFMKSKHCRVLYIMSATPAIIEELSKIELSSGVGIEISITKPQA